MTERDRQREEQEELEHDLLRGPLDDDELDKSPAQLDLEEEQDLHSTDDSGLLDAGDSPEFSHLTRRKQDEA